MASGDTLAVFTPQHNQPPSSGFATLDIRNDHPVLDFDAAASEDAIFGGVLPRHYGGGGIKARVVWMASSATTLEARWEGSFERHQDDAFDLDADGFATEQIVEPTAPSASGEVSYDDITFTNAQIDGLLVGESFRFRLRRNGGHANDDMAGDAELLRVELRET